MKITIVIAGTNEPSNAAYVAKEFAAGMQDARAVDVTTFRLKDVTIEQFCVEKHYATPSQGADDYAVIEQSIQSADAVVIASPIWNFSVPGHLKNFVDRLGALGLDRETHSVGMLRGKPFFFLFTGGIPLPGWTAMTSITSSHMQEALRYFGASIVGTYYEGRCTQGRGVFGLVVDKRPDSLAAIRARGKAFASIVDEFQRTGKLPLKTQLSYRIFRFGYALVNKMVYAIS